MGQTDSERFFALITLAIRDAGGDVRAGIKAAVWEMVEEYEVYSLNFVLGELGHIWAFRYPEHNPLLLHRRDPAASAQPPSSTTPTRPALCECAPTTPPRCRWW